MGTFEAVQCDPAVRPVVGYHRVAHAQVQRGNGSDEYVMIAAFLPVMSAVKVRESVSAGAASFMAVIGRPREWM